MISGILCDYYCGIFGNCSMSMNGQWYQVAVAMLSMGPGKVTRMAKPEHLWHFIPTSENTWLFSFQSYNLAFEEAAMSTLQ